MRLHGFSSLIAGVLFVFAEGCKDIGEPDLQPTPARTIHSSYGYKAYDAVGSLVVTGRMDVSLSSDSTISGGWNFVAAGKDGSVIGPQVGSGKLVGSVQNNRWFINLNPEWVDNNVFLNGSLGDEGIGGIWNWSTFKGPTASGTFEALPILSVM